MDASRWNELQELFAQLAELPADERRARLADQALDPALREPLARMLAAHFADEPLALEARLATTPPPVPVEIGPYRLLRLLGRGGMGEVWLAEREGDGFRQQVALKRIRHGLAGDEVRERFRLERAVLARFAHPGIARLLDGGVDTEGVPFLVLEYVEGEPITAYCDRHRLGLAERLQLLEEVCRAVEVAHANLIVHRDLKPSNILVDGEGRVRLLDFGIAKLLDPVAFGLAAPETRTALRLATPEYAAPEQLRGEAVTTAADVWSLGVLLCELVTGRRPFAAHEGSVAGLERALTEVEPPRPSELVHALPAAARAAAAAARGTTPERLARALAGDLDVLVREATRPDPSRRTPSAERLAEDLRRFRLGLPVLARPDTVRYRLGKFVRRHRAAVAAGATAAALFVVFSIVTALQAVQLARERDAAKTERDAAREVSDVLTSLFSANPLAEEDAYRDSTTLREFIDGSAERVREELADRPLLRARLLTLLARFHGNLGRLDRGLALAEEALALQKAAGDTASAEHGATLTALATILQDQGEYARAEQLFRTALAVRERLGPEANPAVAEAVNNLAVVIETQRQPEREVEAEALLRRGLALRRQLFGDDHLDTAQSFNNLAVFLFRRKAAGDLAEAEALFRQALSIRLARLGEDHPNVAATRSNLANVLHDLGQLDEAEALFRAAIAGWERSLGPEHPRVAAGLFGLHELLADRGDFAAAEEAMLRSLAIDEKSLPADHPYLEDDRQALAKLRARAAAAGAAPTAWGARP